MFLNPLHYKRPRFSCSLFIRQRFHHFSGEDFCLLSLLHGYKWTVFVLDCWEIRYLKMTPCAQGNCVSLYHCFLTFLWIKEQIKKKIIDYSESVLLKSIKKNKHLSSSLNTEGEKPVFQCSVQSNKLPSFDKEVNNYFKHRATRVCLYRLIAASLPKYSNLIRRQ